MKHLVKLSILISTLASFSFSFVNSVNNVVLAEEKTINEVEIKSATAVTNLGPEDIIYPNGRRFTFVIPSGKTSYEQRYTGKVYDLGGTSYDVTFREFGTTTGGRTLLCYIPVHLNCVVIKSTDEFLLDGTTSTYLKFTKSYQTYYGVTPVLKEYNGAGGLELKESRKAYNVNEDFNKRIFDFYLAYGTSYDNEFIGYVYNLDGEKIEAHLKDVGSESGKRILRFGIPLRLDVMCVYAGSLFYEKTTNEPICFDLDYKITYPEIEYTPAKIETFVRPRDFFLTEGLLEGTHDFTSLSFDGNLYDECGYIIPSTFSSVTLKLNKVELCNINTKVSFEVELTKKLKSFILKRSTIFTSKYSTLEIRLDQNYIFTWNGTTYLFEPLANSYPKLKIGNTGNTRSWASDLGTTELPFISQISFADSTLEGAYEKPANNYYYIGEVYDLNDNPIQAKLWLISPQIVVDVMNFKFAIKIASAEKSFRIKSSTIFSLDTQTVSSFPSEITFDKNYIVNFKISTSDVSVIILDQQGGQTTDVPPVIYYNGEKELTYREGECLPLLYARAKDYFNQDVLVSFIYSEGTYDSKYRLIKGNHTITLVAKDNYKNVSTLVITLIVL